MSSGLLYMSHLVINTQGVNKNCVISTGSVLRPSANYYHRAFHLKIDRRYFTYQQKTYMLLGMDCYNYWQVSDTAKAFRRINCFSNG